MSWFGGAMNGNNTAFEFEIEYPSAGITQKLKEWSTGADLDHVHIDWGDGTAIQRVSDIVSATYVEHTYAGTGPYRIRTWQQDFDPNDQSNMFTWDNLDRMGDASYLNTTIRPTFISFGLVRLLDLQFGSTVNTGSYWDMSFLQNYPVAGTSRHYLDAFRNGNTSNLWNWNDYNGNIKTLYWFDHPSSSPTNMAGMFYRNNTCNADIGGWDTSLNTTLNSTFRYCSAFDNGGSDSIGNWDVSNCTDFLGMFFSAFAFNRDITDWDMSSPGKMTHLFRNASSFDQDISKWFTNGGGMGTSFIGNRPFTNMLRSSGLSVTNYSRFLIGAANWVNANSTSAKNLGGANNLEYNNTTHTGIGNETYTDAVSARAYLIAQSWSISGDTEV